ncbi:MAG: ACT domain-containing protein [Gammaproteobacteria bacterium]|jgi:hypothetical protein|nr:ACT domain-containing protein [Gammaproteobacteria bacterium]HUV20744.1 ACT domain-containing protein [Gammaproteobacteria bacterium]
MSGEKNLHKLLAGMSPELMTGEFVFCCFEKARYGVHSELQPIAAITESEGLTLVITKAKADEHSIGYESVFSCITLRVHSSLDAVGLTAAFSGKLGDHGISANVIAGYYHDHIFVQQDQAEKAMTALAELSR